MAIDVQSCPDKPYFIFSYETASIKHFCHVDTASSLIRINISNATSYHDLGEPL